jgi:hypothetical protein
MKPIATLLLLILSTGLVFAQETEIFLLHYAVSKGDTLIYKRIIRSDRKNTLFHVRDYFENGQIQMDAFYSSFDKRVKEEYQCNHHSNVKTGHYTEWYINGQVEYSGNYKKGLRNGLCISWYDNGQKEAEEKWVNGQLHGYVKYWSKDGQLQFDLKFNHGLNKNPANAHYRYLTFVPKDYNQDTLKKWPVIIYLHGGSDRGSDLHKLYSQGIPDEVYRGREFPFIIFAPQCPEHIRWSTENWFDNFYHKIRTEFRIDTNRIYLTGMSLGGSGTWYLAAKYPDLFAAIAPISGFTSHMDFIDDHIDQLKDIPVWAFHGKADNVVPFEETERIIKKLEGINIDMKFTAESNVGHWIHWLIYPKQELFNWFLKHDKRQ